MSLRARSEARKVAGWLLFDSGDYAEPEADAGGFVEVQDDGVFEIAYESGSDLTEMGADHFLLTRVPAEVLRALLVAYDAAREAGK